MLLNGIFKKSEKDEYVEIDGVLIPSEFVKFFKPTKEKTELERSKELLLREQLELDTDTGLKTHAESKAISKDAVAQFKRDLMHDDGDGVLENHTQTVRRYRLAAEGGDANAQFNIAASYYYGDGVPQDFVMAYAWVNLAGANGSDVSSLRGILEDILSQQDMSEAQSLTRQLKKDFPDIY